jgi:hypothetical protein
MKASPPTSQIIFKNRIENKQIKKIHNKKKHPQLHWIWLKLSWVGLY